MCTQQALEFFYKLNILQVCYVPYTSSKISCCNTVTYKLNQGLLKKYIYICAIKLKKKTQIFFLEIFVLAGYKDQNTFENIFEKTRNHSSTDLYTFTLNDSLVFSSVFGTNYFVTDGMCEERITC